MAPTTPWAIKTCHSMCRWGFGLDGIQSTAAESRQDWSSLMHIFSSTTSDPVWSGPHWHHLRAASFFDPRPRGLYRRWHVHEDPRHSRRQSVFRVFTSDPERAAISVTTRLTDLGSCTDCQQGGLLQLGSCWYSWPAAGSAAVRLECRRPFGFLSEAVRTHNPIASWTPLVARFGASHIAAVRSGLPRRCLHGTVPAYLAASFLWTSDVDTRHRLRSADRAMLVVPSTRRSTLGDRAFPVASTRAWNSLQSSVRNAPSLTTFRHELNTALFRSSFDNE